MIMTSFVQRRLELVLLLSIYCLNRTCAKTVHGIFTTKDSQKTLGHYIASFCFYENGYSPEIHYIVNTTGHCKLSFYLYQDEEWTKAHNVSNCADKLKTASAKYDINNTEGNFTLVEFFSPKIWHIIFVDAYTCEKDKSDEPLQKMNFVKFELKLLNPDTLGNPTVHFSEEETGLFRFYQLLSLGYFILACIYGPVLYEALRKEGPMHLVILLITCAMCLQALRAFFMTIHLRSYSHNGLGSPTLDLLSELLDVLSQFVMLSMMLSLSLGWPFVKPAQSFNKLRGRPATRLITALAILQAVLFVWEQLEERGQLMYHAHRSTSGIALVILRLLLAGLFASHLHFTVCKDRSILKREFFVSFTKACLLWFLSYPALVVISWVFSPYLRYKFVTMSVVLAQSAAVIMLYKLFLSRSLFWEVSALSSSLPLRMDKSFSIKLYS